MAKQNHQTKVNRIIAVLKSPQPGFLYDWCVKATNKHILDMNRMTCDLATVCVSIYLRVKTIYLGRHKQHPIQDFFLLKKPFYTHWPHSRWSACPPLNKENLAAKTSHHHRRTLQWTTMEGRGSGGGENQQRQFKIFERSLISHGANSSSQWIQDSMLPWSRKHALTFRLDIWNTKGSGQKHWYFRLIAQLSGEKLDIYAVLKAAEVGEKLLQNASDHAIY